MQIIIMGHGYSIKYCYRTLLVRILFAIKVLGGLQVMKNKKLSVVITGASAGIGRALAFGSE